MRTARGTARAPGQPSTVASLSPRTADTRALWAIVEANHVLREDATLQVEKSGDGALRRAMCANREADRSGGVLR